MTRMSAVVSLTTNWGKELTNSSSISEIIIIKDYSALRRLRVKIRTRLWWICGEISLVCMLLNVLCKPLRLGRSPRSGLKGDQRHMPTQRTESHVNCALSLFVNCALSLFLSQPTRADWLLDARRKIISTPVTCTEAWTHFHC